MDKLTAAAAKWITRDEPGEDFYIRLYVARRKHGLSEGQAVQELAGYMRFRLMQAAELAGDDHHLSPGDLERIRWTQIARQYAPEGEFLFLYRQLEGYDHYEVRSFLQELWKEGHNR